MLNKDSFASLNFGTKATTSSLETIVVSINSKMMLADYAKAYEVELFRRNPVRAKEVGVTEAELQKYFEGILAIRVASIGGDCKVWREAKALYIPSWIEFTISQIGEVIDVDRGLRFIPQFNADVDMNAMLETSDKLRSFISDGVAMSKDAFPRSSTGDIDTMSMAIIGDYVSSQTKDAHPIASYIAAFLGFKLQEEVNFRALYRVRYDDVNFIRAMLLREGSIYC